MAEQAKVIIPKEVAEAIEKITSVPNGQPWNIEVIRSNAEDIPSSFYGIIWRWITRGKITGGLREYFTALVNGYEVEQTPEEQLREYYEGSIRYEEECHNLGKHDRANTYYSERLGVETTLNKLGIEIEGINANTAE